MTSIQLPNNTVLQGRGWRPVAPDGSATDAAAARPCAARIASANLAERAGVMLHLASLCEWRRVLGTMLKLTVFRRPAAPSRTAHPRTVRGPLAYPMMPRADFR